MTASHENHERPHLLIHDGDAGALRTVADLRETIRRGHGDRLWQQVIGTAEDATRAEPLSAFSPVDGRGEEDIRQGNRDYVITHAAGQRILSCALAHMVLEEPRYQEAALAQAATLFDRAAWPEWQDNYHRNRHALDADLRTGQLSRDVGLAYDWLYPALSDRDRQWLIDGLDTCGIQPYLRAVDAGAWWLNAMNNWTTVVVGGMGVCAMALGADHPQSRILLDLALPRMRAYLDEYGPKGEFNECPGYAGSSHNSVLFFAAYRYHCRHEAVPPEIAFLRQHCIWQMYATLPPGVVTPFGDSGPNRPTSRNTICFPAVAAATRDPRLQWFYLEHAAERSPNPPLELLHYDASLAPAPPTPADLPLGRAFPAYDGLVSSRTSLDQTSAACVVQGKGGHGGVNHTHPDAGQIIIQGYGQRLIRDLGKVPYPLDKKAHYHFNSAGHNVLTFDGQDLIWDAQHRARLIGAEFDNEQGGSWAWDLTELYEAAIDVRRSVLHRFPGIVAVYDVAAFKQSGVIRIRWHPETPAEPDEEGHFQVTNNGVTLSGLMTSLDEAAFTFSAGRHRYDPPHDRDRMGNPLPQRNEPYMDMLLKGPGCRVLTLFAVHAPGEPPRRWQPTQTGWQIATAEGVKHVKAMADGQSPPRWSRTDATSGGSR